MDSIDLKIIELLQSDGRMSIKKITQDVALTAPAVSERIRKLERDGIIKGYTALVDAKKLNRQVDAIINVSVAPNDTAYFVELVNSEPMVTECYHVTGAYSYFVKVNAYTVEDLESLIVKFQKLGSTNTQIILSTTISHKPIV